MTFPRPRRGRSGVSREGVATLEKWLYRVKTPGYETREALDQANSGWVDDDALECLLQIARAGALVGASVGGNTDESCRDRYFETLTDQVQRVRMSAMVHWALEELREAVEEWGRAVLAARGWVSMGHTLVAEQAYPGVCKGPEILRLDNPIVLDLVSGFREGGVASILATASVRRERAWVRARAGLSPLVDRALQRVAQEVARIWVDDEVPPSPESREREAMEQLFAIRRALCDSHPVRRRPPRVVPSLGGMGAGV